MLTLTPPRWLLAVWVTLPALIQQSNSLDNGLARTPQMGWNSWNYFGCNINEESMKSMVELLETLGLRDAGYTYFNLDDCWMASQRTPEGKWQADPDRFPSGMKAMADFAHAKGFKFGLYSSAGYATCQGLPASLGYETTDAETLAEWTVDYLKYDNCNSDGTTPEVRYPPMRDALNATGRPILFSMCEWGVDQPSTWATPVGNSWRTTGDITATWESITTIMDDNEPLWPSAAPGGWNDPDMLEVGNGALTEDENKMHFSMWAAMKAPLLIGADLRNIDNSTLDILLNQEIIEVNQDALGVQAHKVWSSSGNNQVDIEKQRFNTMVMFQGSLGEGHIIREEAMTLTEAQQACLALSECRGFTYENSNGDQTAQEGKQLVALWSGDDFVRDPSVTSYYKPMPTASGANEVWAGPLDGHEFVVILLNRSNETATITATWAMVGIEDDTPMHVRDLWAHRDLGVLRGDVTHSVNPHGVQVFRLSPVALFADA